MPRAAMALTQQVEIIGHFWNWQPTGGADGLILGYQHIINPGKFFLIFPTSNVNQILLNILPFIRSLLERLLKS